MVIRTPYVTKDRILFLLLVWLLLGWITVQAEPVPTPPQVPVRGYLLVDYQQRARYWRK